MENEKSVGVTHKKLDTLPVPAKEERIRILSDVKKALKASGVLHQFLADRFHLIHEHKIWQEEAGTLGEWLHDNSIDQARFHKLVSLGKVRAMGGPEVRKVLEENVSESKWKLMDSFIEEDDEGNITNIADIVELAKTGRDMPVKAFAQTMGEKGGKVYPVDIGSPCWLSGMDGVIGSVEDVHQTRDREGYIVILRLDACVMLRRTPSIYFNTNVDTNANPMG